MKIRKPEFDTVVTLTEFLLPAALIAAIIGGVGLAFAINQPTLINLGFELLGIPLFIAAISVYHLQGRPNLRRLNDHTPSDSRPYLVGFGFIFAVAIVLLSLTSGGRPPSFYVLIGVLLTISFFQAQKATKRTAILPVVQSCFVIALFSYSVTLRLPFYYAGTDIMPHLHLTEYILRTGSLIPERVNVYHHFPLFHIFGASFIEITGLSPQQGLFIGTGAAFAITPIIVYSLARRITSNIKLSASSAVIYTALPVVFYYSTYVITRTFAYVGFLLILLAILARADTGQKRHTIVLLIAILYTLLVHHVSFLQMALILGLLFLLAQYSGTSVEFTHPEVWLMAVPVIGYWLFAAEGLVESIFVSRIFAQNLESDFSGITTNVPDFHIIDTLNNHLLLVLLFIGISAALRLKRRRLAVFGLLSLICSIFITYSPIHVFGRLNSFRLERLVLILSPIAAIMLALGTTEIRTRLEQKTPQLAPIAVAILVFVFASTAVTGGLLYDAAADSPEIEWANPPQHFEETDLAAFEYTRQIPQGADVRSDYDSTRYLSTQISDGRVVEGDLQYHNTGYISDPSNPQGRYLVIRQGQIDETGVKFLIGFTNYLWSGAVPTDEKNVVYYNGDVKVALNASYN